MTADRNNKKDPLAAALAIISKLRAAGHAAFLAGGCVRDQLLGLKPKDYDVATDATPPRLLELFPRAKRVGAQFGVILVGQRGTSVEVATFRSDGVYSDGRRPDSVTFGTAKEDARRRDFTINGLFYDPVDAHVIDYVGGQDDLRQKVIRTIGDPNERFREDHLRCMRAVRFAARLNFSIAAETLDAIRSHAAKLHRISPERIWMELEEILTSPNRELGWSLLRSTRLREHLLQNWPVDVNKDQETQHRLAALPPCSIDPSLALASILVGETGHAPTASIARLITRNLRLSNRLTDDVLWLLRSFKTVRYRPPQTLEPADLKLLMAHSQWDNLLQLFKADLIATGCSLESYAQLNGRARQIPLEQIAPPPFVTGDDLIEMGETPGERFGELLEALYRAQLNEEIKNREQALELARIKLTTL